MAEMALTPLPALVTNDEGAPVEGATIEIVNRLTGLPATGYEEDGFGWSEMVGPYLTDSEGSKVIWLPNGRYEWRSAGTWVSRWWDFRAYAGYGAEGIYADALGAPVSLDAPVPANGSPATLDTITVPSSDVDDVVGLVAVTVDFAFSNMWDLKLSILNPSAGSGELWRGTSSLSSSANDYAFDGQVTFVVAGGDDNFNVPMVDGGTYNTGGAVASRGGQPSGNWVLQWEGANDPLDFSGHTGELRGWSLELIPD